MRSRLQVRALVDEACFGVLVRPGRTVLTTLGTVLGVGAFVAVLGLTGSASGQISKRFTALAATEVTVEDVSAAAAGSGLSFPIDADQRVAALPGVVHAGVFWTVPPARIRSVSGSPTRNVVADPQPVIAASAGFLQAIHPSISAGRTFDQLHDARADPVALIGQGLAERLGISGVAHEPAIFVNGNPLTVIGIIGDVARQPEVMLSAIVPRRTAQALWGLPDDPMHPARMLIETRLGAARVVGQQTALALRPDIPDLFRVHVPADPHALRDEVSSDLTSLLLALAVVCLIIGTVSIANTSLVAVMERAGEIGLRRAHGARRWHIAAQFLAESAMVGLFGGLVGATAGLFVVVVTALANDWTPVIAAWIVLSSPAVGLFTGIVAGTYPAIRAARVQPADALRR